VLTFRIFLFLICSTLNENSHYVTVRFFSICFICWFLVWSSISTFWVRTFCFLRNSFVLVLVTLYQFDVFNFNFNFQIVVNFPNFDFCHFEWKFLAIENEWMCWFRFLNLVVIVLQTALKDCSTWCVYCVSCSELFCSIHIQAQKLLGGNIYVSFPLNYYVLKLKTLWFL